MSAKDHPSNTRTHLQVVTSDFIPGVSQPPARKTAKKTPAKAPSRSQKPVVDFEDPHTRAEFIGRYVTVSKSNPAQALTLIRALSSTNLELLIDSLQDSEAVISLALALTGIEQARRFRAEEG